MKSSFFKRIAVLVFSALVAWTGASASMAQPGARAFRLLILDSQQGNPYDEVRSALAQALKVHGYVEGRNLRTTLRVTGNDAREGEHVLRAEIGNNRYDVIFVGGTAATISAKNVLLGDMSQRVVFGAPTDPVGIGVIKELSEGKQIADIRPEWPKTYGFAVDLPKSRQFSIVVPVELLQLSGDNIVK